MWFEDDLEDRLELTDEVKARLDQGGRQKEECRMQNLGGGGSRRGQFKTVRGERLEVRLIHPGQFRLRGDCRRGNKRPASVRAARPRPTPPAELGRGRNKENKSCLREVVVEAQRLPQTTALHEFEAGTINPQEEPARSPRAAVKNFLGPPSGRLMRPGIRADEPGESILCASLANGRTADPFREKGKQLLLLLTRQRFHSSFNFGNRAHA
jgi:hypothetical protein